MKLLDNFKKCQIFTLFFLGLFLISFPTRLEGSSVDIPSRLTLTMVTYNIRRGEKGLEGIAKTLKKIDPDIVFLQEIHGPSYLPGWIDQAKQLSHQLHLNYAFGKARLWISGEYGIATLSRFPILEKKVLLLPNLPGEEQEALLILKVQTDLGPLILMNTHLFSTARQKGNKAGPLRHVQAQRIMKEILQQEHPVIFGADLNVYANSKIKHLFSKHMVDVFKETGRGRGATFPAKFPLARIDYLYIKGFFRLLDSRVYKSKASDHRPVWGKVQWIKDPLQTKNN